VAPEPVRWTWRNRAAKGKLGLIIGDPGKGKTSFALELCARRSQGSAWPDGTWGDAAEDSLYFSAEDGPADTLRVRIDLQGGDPRRVHVLTAVRERGQDRMPTLEHDLAAIEQAIIRCTAKLVIIDPLSAYLGSRDSYKDAEIRSLLGPLAALAERHGVAILGILHLNKTAQRQILHRAGASIAFVAAARTVLVVCEDAEVPERRLLISAKNNLGPLAPTLAFRISDAGLRWDEGEVAGAVERLLAGDEMPTRSEARALDRAGEFLRKLLDDGPVPSTQIEKDAKANGISQRTLWRAKDDLGITSSRMPGQRGTWFWALPGPAA
jgi:putative DNA primase/helicase